MTCPFNFQLTSQVRIIAGVFGYKALARMSMLRLHSEFKSVKPIPLSYLEKSASWQLVARIMGPKQQKTTLSYIHMHVYIYVSLFSPFLSLYLFNPSISWLNQEGCCLPSQKDWKFCQIYLIIWKIYNILTLSYINLSENGNQREEKWEITECFLAEIFHHAVSRKEETVQVDFYTATSTTEPPRTHQLCVCFMFVML